MPYTYIRVKLYIDSTSGAWYEDHMTQSMKTISLYIEPKQLARLKSWSKETGAPVSEIIRRAIEAALKAKEEKK